LKPGSIRRVDPGLKPGRIEKKIREEKTRRDLVKNPVATC
jgi:hypothetical protein